MASGSTITVDTRDMDRAAKAVEDAAKSLDPKDSRLRGADSMMAVILVRELHAAASVSVTPQAAIVAQSAQVVQGETVGVSLGGTRSVGSRGSPAGAILWGSERGGPNFDASRGGAYWIKPATDRARDLAASSGGPYTAALNAILRGSGLL